MYDGRGVSVRSVLTRSPRAPRIRFIVFSRSTSVPRDLTASVSTVPFRFIMKYLSTDFVRRDIACTLFGVEAESRRLSGA